MGYSVQHMRHRGKCWFYAVLKMSRRKKLAAEVHDVLYLIDWRCARCRDRAGRDKVLGLVVRRPSLNRDMLSIGLERIDGPNGETKVRAVCPTCLNEGHNSDVQLRWERLKELLDRLERSGQHEIAIYPT